MLAALYTRVSLDRKQRQRSITEQEDDGRAACAERGWEVTDVFCDNDRSASRYATKERPRYLALLEAISSRQFGVLVLWEPSRGSRELEEWAGLLNRCLTVKVLIYIVDHDRLYDLDRPNDWRDLATDGVDSVHESNKTRTRVRRHMSAAASRGLPHGKLAYGFDRRYGMGGVLIEQVIDEAQAIILREAAKRVLAGESCYAVAKDFTARGIPAPAFHGLLRRAEKLRDAGKDEEAAATEVRAAEIRWDGTEVKRLLINPAYAGKRVHRPKITGPNGPASITDAVWPAILDEDDHHRLVALLTDPARNTVTDPTVKWLLTGLAKCAVCGGRMRPQKNRGVRGYMCRAAFCVSVRVDWLEDFVTKILFARLNQPDAAEAFVPRDDADLRAAAQDELAGLKARLEGFTVQAALGKLTPQTLARIEAELTPMIEDAERRAKPVHRSPVIAALTLPGVDVRAVWDGLDIVGRREAVQTLVDLRVGRGKPGARSFDPARLGASRWIGADRTWAAEGFIDTIYSGHK
jgi:site-specific DNA recombinase